MGRPAGSKNKPKPVIQAREISPWGDASEEEFQQSTRDRFFVKGYSDKRAANDLAKSEGKPQERLEYRLHYVSVQRVSGAPDGNKVAEFQADGYRVLKYEECDQFGINPAESGFTKGEDGTCRVGSQMLMICPGPRAAANMKRQQAATNLLSDSTKGALETAGEKFNAEHGLSRDGGTEFTYQEDVAKTRERR